MKKWTGGVLIIGLTCVLLFSYSFIQKQPQKQSAYQFFHPDDDEIANFSKPVGEKLETLTIKPRLVDVDGLDYLFNSTHTLKQEELKPLLAWGQMRLLLSRSDSLPETAQGIKEAAAAWKELKSEIDEARVSKFDHSTMDKNCSFSVSAMSGSSLVASNDTVILAIPCGLIVDSSVTLIAIPDGNQDGFQIEFVGSQGKDETDPPVVLHYNVVLPGDNFTKEPVIVQNTWTYESGWGKEERCPNHGSSNNVKGIYTISKCVPLCPMITKAIGIA